MICARCGRRLAGDEPYVSITGQREHQSDGAVVVDESVLLMAACTDCAPGPEDAAAALQSLMAT